MSELDRDYKDALEEAKWRYSTHGLSAANRSHDFGMLAVKNALLVSGGGLFFIPAMVGLSAEVDLSKAIVAGFFFGGGVLLTLIINYVIHMNWMLHEAIIDEVYNIERIKTHIAYERELSTDNEHLKAAEVSHENLNWWISFTFWIPHILAILFIIFLIAAAYYLYLSFGVIQPDGAS